MVSITNYADKQVQRMTWINGLWLVQGVQDLSWTSRSPRFIGLWLVQGVQDLSWTSRSPRFILDVKESKIYHRIMVSTRSPRFILDVKESKIYRIMVSTRSPRFILDVSRTHR
jgi:hypothetical protein